jgi:hypothetical protein
MYLDIGDCEELFKTAVASWMIDKGIPFSMVEEKSFRKMFETLNKKSSEIVNVDNKSIREVVMHHGRLAKEATQIEMEGQEVAWTTDHWTGPNDQTYSTVTAHFITANWSYISCTLDLNVFKGTTTGTRFIMILRKCWRSFKATAQRSFLTVLESQIPQATWASWDNIVARTEGGMGTVQIITSIAMLSLLLMVSKWIEWMLTVVGTTLSHHLLLPTHHTILSFHQQKT